MKYSYLQVQSHELTTIKVSCPSMLQQERLRINITKHTDHAPPPPRSRLADHVRPVLAVGGWGGGGQVA